MIQKRDIGWQEIIVIVVIVVVLFGLVKMFGDKRYLKRPGGKGGAQKDNGGQRNP